MVFDVDLDGLYVVSDLHLGGEKGFQIFGSVPEFRWFIDEIRATEAKGKTGLLINGDFVDFLAEADPKYFDPLGACDRLDRIFLQDPDFRHILTALRKFVATPNKRLFINLGNHDLEIALPWVCEHFVDLISNGDTAARGRICITKDGAGISFNVGSARIYCAHGNEVDSWNVTDHESIRKISRDVLQGSDPNDWIPNAGTQLVIEAMNSIKRRYPFVDLLKPETEAVVPILLALQPSLAAKIISAPRVLARKARDAVKMKSGFLGEGIAEQREQDNVLTPLGEAILRSRNQDLATELLDEADAHFRDDLSPMDLLSADQQGRHLGRWSAFHKRVSGGSKSEILRERLDGLFRDPSFDTTHPDDTFLAFDARISDKADVVVTGHTHLERALPRVAASGYYFNTGTWARLIQIDEDRLNEPFKFKEMVDAIEVGSMAALDDVANLVQRRNTVFSAKPVGGRTQLELHHVTKAGRSYELKPVANTKFIVR